MYEAITRMLEQYWNTPNTDYAILLNGEWGCGKTYYVEHELKSALKNCGCTFIYASLHGVRDFDQVNQQLMLSHFEDLAGSDSGEIRASYWLDRFLRDINESSSLWGKLVRSFFMGWHYKYIREAAKLSKDSTFVVIDDLERAADESSLRQILGWIFEQYIRRGYRVLLIGDETRFEKGSAYFECKEKYVRRTINVCQWQGDFVREFAKSRCVKPDWLYPLIEPDLSQFLKEKNVVNLRVVAMMIDGIVDVVNRMNDDFAKRHATFLFKSLAPLLHAVAKGLLVPENIEDNACLDQLSNVQIFYRDAEKREPLDPKMERAYQFYDQYCKGLDCFYTFVRPLFVYALTGHIDREELQRELARIFDKQTTPEGLALDGLQSYWTSEENDLLNVVLSVKQFLEDGKYGFGEIVDIYSYFWGIKKDTYLSAWPFEEDLTAMFLRFVDIRIKAGEPCPSRESMLSCEICGRHFCDERADINLLHEKMKEYYRQTVARRNEERINCLFDCLKRGDRQGANKYLLPIDGRWNFFADLDAGDRIKDVPMLPVMGLKYIEYQAREHILQITNSGDFEYGQVPSMRKLMGFLRGYVDKGEDSVSRLARMKDVIVVLENSIKHMDDYRGKCGHVG